MSFLTLRLSRLRGHLFAAVWVPALRLVDDVLANPNFRVCAGLRFFFRLRLLVSRTNRVETLDSTDLTALAQRKAEKCFVRPRST